MQNTLKLLPALVLAVIFTVGWQIWSLGQQPRVDKSSGEKSTKVVGNRLEFEVVHSFDGKYLGDTPGHMGRTGGLTGPRPRIALGDKVYREDEVVGIVTNLELNRGNNSLDIEFNPVDRARVCVGDTVWLTFDNSSPRRVTEPQQQPTIAPGLEK
jgi:hypothetical protein